MCWGIRRGRAGIPRALLFLAPRKADASTKRQELSGKVAARTGAPKQPQTQWDGEHELSAPGSVFVARLAWAKLAEPLIDSLTRFRRRLAGPRGGHIFLVRRPRSARFRSSGPSLKFPRNGREVSPCGAAVQVNNPEGLGGRVDCFAQGKMSCDADGRRCAGVGGIEIWCWVFLFGALSFVRGAS